MATTKQEYDAVRINFLDPTDARGTSTSYDARFLNGFFDPVYNKVKQDIEYFYTKRPGMTPLGIFPQATGRGIYAWKGHLYAVCGTKIYKDSSLGDLGITTTTSSGEVAFAETRPGATTQYLGMTDGTALYLIKTDDSVIVLNNVVISTSSVANPTTITTATNHGLATGNKVYIVGHSGSTPDINGTVYTITKTGNTTFTIPVNVTVAGTGGTLGVFPATNVGSLEYMDGYWVTAKSDGTIWNCDVDNPLVWDPTKYITAQMYPGNLVGIAHTNNYLFAFGEGWMQAFYNGNNANGSFLTNAESAVQQIGCVSNNSISHEENTIYWVSYSKTGGFSVYQLDGTANLKEIGTPQINRVISKETSPNTIYANVVRIAGKYFYLLSLPYANRTFVYDTDLEIWVEWTDYTGSAKFPAISIIQTNDALLSGEIYLQRSDGVVFGFSTAYGDDPEGSFPFVARTKRFDSGTMKRKFCTSLDLIGDQQSSTTNVNVYYSDDDYFTISGARTLDMAVTRPFTKALGNFRRRSWQTTYTGSNPCRIVGIEIVYSIGDS